MENSTTKPFYNTTIPSDWKEVKIKDIGKITSGTTPLRSNMEYHKNGVIPWVKTTDLNNSIIVHTEERISEVALKETSLRIYPIDTVLVAMYGGFNQIGRTGILGVGATINQALSAITVNKSETDPIFLLNWLNAKVGLWKKLAGSSRKDPNITSKDVGDFPFLKMPLPEQKAIADILVLIDTAIDQNNQLIAQKELRKKWLIQNLLTGKKRLKGFENGKWKIKSLEDILTPSRKSFAPKKDELYQQIGIRSHTKGIFYKEKVTGATLGDKSVFWIEPDCFIVNIVFAWEHAIAKTTENEIGMIASHRFPMYKPKRGVIDLDYLLYYFKSPRGKHLLGLVSPGGAGRNKTLGQSDF